MIPDSTSQSETTVTVRFGAWYDETELPLTFPPGWQVRRLDPDDAPAISQDQVDEAFARPIGTETLQRLAVGKRSATVAVDDLTRPTPVGPILPRVIAELTAGGIAPDQIHILIGAAAHRPMSPNEMAVKLGADVVGRFKPIMHDFMGPDVRHVGWVRGGPVALNRHFLEADLRVCIGGVIPHAETGFGGGAKMVVPGLAGRATIAHFHGALPPRPAGQLTASRNLFDRRGWAEQVARHVGVDAAVCAVINARRELGGLYVGDIVAAHEAAARQARRVGRTVVSRDQADGADVVVVNAYPLDTDPIQMGKSIEVARKLSAKLTVVINAASDGVFYHGMGMGSGVDLKRLLRNVPGWLASPAAQYTLLRSMLQAVCRPTLTARLCYFSLNHLAYAAFEGQAARRAPITTPNGADGGKADPFLFSKRFPTWAFRHKYPRGRLYREWQALRDQLAHRIEKGRVLVFPCAPLQLLEIA